jgi:regulator of sigma E protease
VGLCLMPLLALTLWSKLAAFGMAAIGLGFVIFVHELGHFLVAKLCGVKCEKFYVGFDVPIRLGPLQLPRTLFRKQWGETEYGIGIIPLGGYVKMLGQDDNPANSAKEAERIRMAREQSGGEVGAPHQLDPRSYPAKTVPQRMAIISAGVIMNLIFAVIFGMVAYRLGVTYTPTVVGGTSPGLSAWEVGLQPGDRIIQMGRAGSPSQHLRFDKDMMVKVMMTGPQKELDLLAEPHRGADSEPRPPHWVTVHLSGPQESHHGRPMIGIAPARTTTIGGTVEQRAQFFAHLPGGRAEPPLEPGDRIVGVNGLPVDDYSELSRELARGVDHELVLDVERPATGESAEAARITVTLPPNPVRSLGLRLGMGPIVGFQRGSVGQQAGLEVGDRLVAVNGQPVLNPMKFPDVIRRLAGQAVELTVERGSPEQLDMVTIMVTPVTPSTLDIDSSQQLMAVQSLGLVYQVENIVNEVFAGSPAAKAGVQPGDVVQTAEFVAGSPESAEIEKEIFGRSRPIRLGQEKLDWPLVHGRLQGSLPDTQVRLTYQRGDHLHTVDLMPQVAEDWFDSERGLGLTMLEEVHAVDSWASSFALGWRETVDSIRQVYVVLYRLIAGQFSPTNLGGPAAIATMAGLEAAESPARLLIFLTLLSANLAVINFLPIPVLDGGHAMFLMYEGIFRKPVNERVAFGLTMVGFCFILGLMLFVIGLDVLRLSGLVG